MAMRGVAPQNADEKFLEAALYGDLRRLKALWPYATLDHADEIGFTALHKCCFYDKDQCTRFLIDQGADINAVCPRYGTPLCFALVHQAPGCAELLLDFGARPNEEGGVCGSALHLACMYGELDICKELLQKGASATLLRTVYVEAAFSRRGLPAEMENSRNNAFECQPLVLAARFGHLDVATLLLQHDAPVNATFRYWEGSIGTTFEQADINSRWIGQTALFQAAFMGHRDIVSVLIKYGGQCGVRSSNGQTALHYAVKYSRCVSDILCGQNGGRGGTAYQKTFIDTVSKRGKTALYLAAQHGYAESVRQLVDAGAAIDLPKQIGSTPLMAACEGGHTECVLILTSHKANIALKNSKGKTALAYAVNNDHHGPAYVLVQHGASVDDESVDRDKLLKIMATMIRSAKMPFEKIFEIEPKPSADDNGESRGESDGDGTT